MNGSGKPPWTADQVIESAQESEGAASCRASSESGALSPEFSRRRATRVASLERTHDTASVTCVGTFRAFNLAQASDADPLHLHLLPGRLFAATRAPCDARLLRDRIIEILRSLEPAPLSRVELARRLHFRLRSEEELRRVTRSFAPIAIWQRHLIDPALTSLTIEESQSNLLPGRIEVQLRVSPSERDSIEVTITHHFELHAESVAPTAAALIAERWDDVMCTAIVVADELIADVLNDAACA
jgi:hypothetical protein